jgi:phage/plasmid-like protein (TIGR03299 family)
MSHGLMKDRMAYVGSVPWHGLGKAVAETVTATEMIKAAGLDWRVWLQPAPGARLLQGQQAAYDRYLVMRDPVENEAVPVALGFVGSSYRELQNVDAFRFFEPFIADGYAQFHTAGALDNGQRVWVLAKLKDQILVGKEDLVDRYLLLSNSHDGSSAVSISFTPIRVVCQNTLALAQKNRVSAISIRHDRSLKSGLERAQQHQLKSLIEKVYSDAATLFGKMAAFEVKADQVETFLEVLFPKTEQQRERNEEPERWTRIKRILKDESVTPPETRHTLWAVYNAVVRDEDYRPSREAGPEARLNRIWFGSGQALKLKALEKAQELVQAEA